MKNCIPASTARATISKFVAGAFVAGTMAFGAGTASALTLTDNSGILQGVGSVNTSNDFTTIDVDFNWTATPSTQFLNFTITEVTDLFFTDYVSGDSIVSTLNFNQSSEISLDLLDAVNGVAASRLNETDTPCANATAPISGGCQLITSATSTGGSTGDADRPDWLTPLFDNLAAGSYRLGFFESNQPLSGSASFAITTAPSVSAVPVPAALPLFGTGLAIMGFIGWRKKRKVAATV